MSVRRYGEDMWRRSCDSVLGKNPSMRIVINVIALESLQAVLPALKAMEIEPEIVCMQVSGQRKAGPYHSDEGGKSGVYSVVWGNGEYDSWNFICGGVQWMWKNDHYLRALPGVAEEGLKVKAWKCGPDFIDPMFHKQVLGISGEIWDGFSCQKRRCGISISRKMLGLTWR